jgi:hypothetical protein
MQVFRSIGAAGAALALLSAPANAQTTAVATNVNSVIAGLTARMDPVSGYQARVHVNIHLHSFPFLAANLEGKTSYTRPGRYVVTFDSLPSLASAFQKVSGDIGDPAAWLTKYEVSIDPATATATPGTLVLRLTEKLHGQIDHALAYVERSSNTVTRMEWYYYSGGRIAMEQHFAPVSGVQLVDHQAADIDMPGYRATAEAAFDGYNVQVSVSPTTRAVARQR